MDKGLLTCWMGELLKIKIICLLKLYTIQINGFYRVMVRFRCSLNSTPVFGLNISITFYAFHLLNNVQTKPCYKSQVNNNNDI